jgi:hypothetical protein
MALIVYIPSENELERRFLALLEMAIPDKRFEICHSIDELSAKLEMPLFDVKVAILFAVTRKEITQILALGDWMADVKSILVLSDGDKDTMAMAHKLRPRYVTWVNSDPIDLVTVARRMVDLYDAPQGRRRKQQGMSEQDVMIGSHPMET